MTLNGSQSTWYFIRHAETYANLAKQYNPDEDGLTPSGLAQAEAAAQFIMTLNLDQAFSSPLRRTEETAEALGVSPILVPALTDRKWGSFAGKHFGSLRTYCVQHGLDPDTFAPEGGETYDQMEKRALTFLTGLPKGNFLFVSHAGVITQVLHHITGRHWSDMRVENCALWVLRDGKLVHENWRPWLETDK